MKFSTFGNLMRIGLLWMLSDVRKELLVKCVFSDTSNHHAAIQISLAWNLQYCHWWKMAPWLSLWTNTEFALFPLPFLSHPSRSREHVLRSLTAYPAAGGGRADAHSRPCFAAGRFFDRLFEPVKTMRWTDPAREFLEILALLPLV